MKPASLIGILLIVFGAVALAYQGFSYTTRENKKIVDLGPLQVNATVEKRKTVPLPPVLGFVALAGGITLVLVANRK